MIKNNTKQKFCLVKTAFESENDAENMAKALISRHLIVSGQIKRMRSLYVWKNELCDEQEFELTCFTETGLYDAVEQFINDNHPYEVGEIIRIPVTDTSDEFGQWISEYVNKKAGD